MPYIMMAKTMKTRAVQNLYPSSKTAATSPFLPSSSHSMWKGSLVYFCSDQWLQLTPAINRAGLRNTDAVLWVRSSHGAITPAGVHAPVKRLMTHTALFLPPTINHSCGGSDGRKTPFRCSILFCPLQGGWWDVPLSVCVHWMYTDIQ